MPEIKKNGLGGNEEIVYVSGGAQGDEYGGRSIGGGGIVPETDSRAASTVDQRQAAALMGRSRDGKTAGTMVRGCTCWPRRRWQQLRVQQSEAAAAAAATAS
jgi:hypothetical protein